MTTPSREDDDGLLDELRVAKRSAGEPTPTMTAAAAAALSWRTVDAELAELVRDLPPGPREPGQDDHVLVRDDGSGPAVLRFRLPDATLELQEDEDGWLGVLVPPAEGRVTVLAADGTALDSVEVGGAGYFRLAGAEGGPVRLRFPTASGERLTDWCLLR